MGLIRYRSFHVTYIPATNNRPSRIKIRDCWHGDVIRISFTEPGGMLDYAQSALVLLGFDIVAMANTNSGDRGYDLLLCENFELRLK